jgi:predicted DNA-binding transcriptional regulator AlpA
MPRPRGATPKRYVASDGSESWKVRYRTASGKQSSETFYSKDAADETVWAYLDAAWHLTHRHDGAPENFTRSPRERVRRPERLPHAGPLHLVPEDAPLVVGTYQIAEMFNVSRPRVAQIVGTKGFPDPIQKLGKAHIWLAGDVETWARGKKRTIYPYGEED